MYLIGIDPYPYGFPNSRSPIFQDLTLSILGSDIAYQLWLRIKGFVPEIVGQNRRALGCSPRIRVYRYVKGQRFGQHVDGSRDEPELGGRTHFTVLVYLNGGERDKEIQVGPKIWWFLMNFDGHFLGATCFYHEWSVMVRAIEINYINILTYCRYLRYLFHPPYAQWLQSMKHLVTLKEIDTVKCITFFKPRSFQTYIISFGGY